MNKKKAIIAGVIVVLLIIGGVASATVVEAGHTGVVVTLGAVDGSMLSEGLHFKVPFAQNVISVDNRTQNLESEGTASSKDLQTITYKVAVNYRVENNASAELYKTVGLGFESIIVSPAIQESIKSVTARFTAEELIVKRQDVSDEIKIALSEKINEYGIYVEIFNIVNFEFSDEFNTAVEAKQTAQQAALKAEQDLARIKIEAEQTIEQARAEAESIKLIQDTLAQSPNYIDYLKWTKWDGVLPAVMSDSDMLFDATAFIEPDTNSSTQQATPPVQQNTEQDTTE